MNPRALINRHKKKVFLVMIIVIILFGVYITRYKLKRDLPLINKDEVTNITFSDYYEQKEPIDIYDNKIIDWYNNAIEIKSDIGTTTDCCINIYLEGGDYVRIENMFLKDIVSVRYIGEEYTVQVNVKSEKMATYIDDLKNTIK